MQTYEIPPLIERSYLRDMESWEQTRLLAGLIGRAWFKDYDTPSFPWDRSEEVIEEEDDVERLMELARQKELIKKESHGK